MEAKNEKMFEGSFSFCGIQPRFSMHECLRTDSDIRAGSSAN
jgi:hypothetical protein